MEPVMTLQIIRNMIFDFQEFVFFNIEKFMIKREEDKKKVLSAALAPFTAWYRVSQLNMGIQ